MTMFGSQWLANVGSTYEIEQSIRFNDGDSPYLTRTPGSASNRDTWTWSAWIKICTIDQNSRLFFAGADTSNLTAIRLNSAGIAFEHVDGGSFTDQVQTSALLRDPSAWYHIVFAVDTTDATEANRVKIYINGTVQTSLSLSNYPGQNVDTDVNSADVHSIGSRDNAGLFFDGYMAEINFVDGTQVAASSFGETNSDTGQWVPKKYTGAYGTNGFYLKGQDSSALGDDTSGNGNDFSSSGLAANDQMSDSPTNNWCTLSPLDASIPALNNGNLGLAGTSSAAWLTTRATMSIPSSGKWYWECIATTSGNAGDPHFGIVADSVNTQYADWLQDPLAYYYTTRNDTVVNNDYVGTSRGTYNGGNVLQIAYDADTGKLHFGIQNSWINGGDPADGSDPDFTTSTTPTFLPYAAIYNNKTGSINFGQSAFAYTPPTDFLALNSANLPDPTIADPSAYFQTTLYEGDGSTQSIDQAGNSTFSPNLVWIKNRDAADAHALFDTVRGATEVLSANSPAAEATNADTLTAFESDGFALGDDVIVNTNNESYVAWQWNEGATPGFDIVSWTGNATARTIAHNLGVVPEMMFVKNRDQGDKWGVYHSGNTSAPATEYLILNENDATADEASVWNDTAPTSSVFTVGVASLVNANTEDFIAYIFAPVKGFSAFGSYAGNNNANGPMINVGFRPAFIMIKAASTTGSWLLFDTKRDTFNAAFHVIYGQLDNAEDTAHAYGDILSNGFKIRKPGEFAINDDATYIYMAFAESPFKTANAR